MTTVPTINPLAQVQHHMQALYPQLADPLCHPELLHQAYCRIIEVWHTQWEYIDALSNVGVRMSSSQAKRELWVSKDYLDAILGVILRNPNVSQSTLKMAFTYQELHLAICLAANSSTYLMLAEDPELSWLHSNRERVRILIQSIRESWNRYGTDQKTSDWRLDIESLRQWYRRHGEVGE